MRKGQRHPADCAGAAPTRARSPGLAALTPGSAAVVSVHAAGCGALLDGVICTRFLAHCAPSRVLSRRLLYVVIQKMEQHIFAWPEASPHRRVRVCLFGVVILGGGDCILMGGAEFWGELRRTLRYGRCGKDRTAPFEGGWRGGLSPLPATRSFSPGGSPAPGPLGAWRGAARQRGWSSWPRGFFVSCQACALSAMAGIAADTHRGGIPPLALRGVCVFGLASTLVRTGVEPPILTKGLRYRSYAFRPIPTP